MSTWVDVEMHSLGLQAAIAPQWIRVPDPAFPNATKLGAELDPRADVLTYLRNEYFYGSALSPYGFIAYSEDPEAIVVAAGVTLDETDDDGSAVQTPIGEGRLAAEDGGWRLTVPVATDWALRVTARFQGDDELGSGEAWLRGFATTLIEAGPPATTDAPPGSVEEPPADAVLAGWLPSEAGSRPLRFLTVTGRGTQFGSAQAVEGNFGVGGILDICLDMTPDSDAISLVIGGTTDNGAESVRFQGCRVVGLTNADWIAAVSEELDRQDIGDRPVWGYETNNGEARLIAAGEVLLSIASVDAPTIDPIAQDFPPDLRP